MIGYDTFDNMVTEVGNYLGDTGATRATKIKNSINKYYAHIVRKWRWPSLQFLAESESIAAATSLFYLPKHIEKVYFLLNADLDEVALRYAVESFFSFFPATEATSGIITDFAEAGEFGRSADFSSTAEKIDLVSSSSSDTNVVVIRGLNSAGTDEIKEQVTLAGTVTQTSANTYSEIFSISSDGTQSGVVTASGTTSSTTYATIAPTERTARYKALRLRMLPSATTNIKYWAKRKVNRLTYDEDVIDIPVAQALIEFALMDHFAQQRKWQEGATFHYRTGTEILDTITKDIDVDDKIEIPMPVPRGQELGTARRIGGVIVRNG